jgi:hypothetical protein
VVWADWRGELTLAIGRIIRNQPERLGRRAGPVCRWKQPSKLAVFIDRFRRPTIWHYDITELAYFLESYGAAVSAAIIQRDGSLENYLKRTGKLFQTDALGNQHCSSVLVVKPMAG